MDKRATSGDLKWGEGIALGVSVKQPVGYAQQMTKPVRLKLRG